MDEIDIVKKRSHVWMWVVGLIILAAIIWAVVAMSGRGTSPASELVTPTPQPHPVADRLKL